MDWSMDWRMNGWEDVSEIDRWANRYNTLYCSEATGPKWAIVVGNKLETKNDDKKVSTVSTVCPSLSTHSKHLSAWSNNMDDMLILSWTMF